LLLAACGSEADGPAQNTPEVEDGAEAHERSHEAAAEGIRGPAGADAVDCSSGSDDPEQIDLFAESAGNGNLSGAIRGLETLCGRHPSSATARVRLGEMLLRTQPPRAAQADTWLTRALELHELGCTLGFRDHWAALEGQALSHMMRGDYAAAIAPLRASIRAWPGLRSTHYNLACALCQTGDVPGCRAEIEIALSNIEAPSFLAEQSRPADHYRAMVRRDPDLAPLRVDAAALASLLD